MTAGHGSDRLVLGPDLAERLRQAERAAADLATLQRLTAALAATLDQRAVAEVIVSSGRDAFGAYAGTLGLLTPGGGEIEFVGFQGYGAHVLDDWSRIPVDTHLPVPEAARTGRAVWLESPEERATRYPLLARVAPGSQSSVAVPLLVQGRAIGAVSFAFDRPRRFDTEDRELIEALAGQCAQAIERARLYAAERQARTEAEIVADRLGRLQELTSRLASAQTVQDVADVVLTYGLSKPGAASGGLWVRTEDGRAVRLIGSTGMESGVSDRFVEIPLDSHLPAADVMRTGEALYFRSRAERDARYPMIAGTPTRVEAVATVPLRFEGEVIGCLAMGFPEVRDFDDAKRRFLDAIAAQCAQTLERARLHDAERLAGSRLDFLARASKLLTSTLDYEGTLARVAELGLGLLGSLCVLDLVEPGGLRRVATAHADPARPPAPHRPPDDGALLDPVVAEVLRTGLAVVLPETAGEQPDAAAGAAPEPGTGPSLVAPLVAGGRTLGVLRVARDRGARPYAAEDVTLTTELASRAAVAIENARLFAQRTEVAQTLQRSLLPPRLPAVPGVDLAARFRPSSEGLDIGGDFYDVFPVGDEWALVLGDVVGSGPRAAATTAVVRHTVRAVAPLLRDPCAVAAAVNRALADGVDDSFCTLLYGTLSTHGRGVRVRLVGAGHPAPYVVRAGGGIEELPAAGTLLGPFEDIELVPVEVELGPGDALVCLTDGVLEARAAGAGRGAGPESFFGDAGVRRSLGGGGGSAREIAARLEAAALEFAGGSVGDDIAILVFRAD